MCPMFTLELKGKPWHMRRGAGNFLKEDQCSYHRKESDGGPGRGNRLSTAGQSPEASYRGSCS